MYVQKVVLKVLIRAFNVHNDNNPAPEGIPNINDSTDSDIHYNE